MSQNLVSDVDTGLFSEGTLRALLPSRVATARRTLRQLGLVLVRLDDDGLDPTAVAALVEATVRDSDMAARLDDGALALVLEFTPADGCGIVVERMRALLAADQPDAALRAGIACYPAHAISADELLAAATTALADAAPGDTVTAPVPD